MSIFKAEKAPWKKAANTRFKKGNTPHNKGKKQTEWLSPESIENSKKTQFKKGQKPPKWKPIGSERVNTDGTVQVKVQDGKDGKNWAYKHHLVWEEANGKIPDGHVIVFLDGNAQNCELENLKLVSRGNLMKVNHEHGKATVDPEVKELMYNVAELDSTTKEKEEELKKPKKNPMVTKPVKKERVVSKTKKEIVAENIDEIESKVQDPDETWESMGKVYGMSGSRLHQIIKEDYPSVFKKYRRGRTKLTRDELDKRNFPWWKPLPDFEVNGESLWWEYYVWWCWQYKHKSVRPITFISYRHSANNLRKLRPEMKVKEINRLEYQRLINDFGETKEKQTVMDFNNQLKKSLKDLVYEGILEKDPTYDITINFGVDPIEKPPKWISEEELIKLLEVIDKGYQIDDDNAHNKWAWMTYLISTTGLRFAEALGVTAKDFDFETNELSITKSFNYRFHKLDKTKNRSSVRTVKLDSETAKTFNEIITFNDFKDDDLLFVQDKKIHNSTMNKYLEEKCKEAGIPRITVHNLRHTHVSILLAKGVNMLYVSKRIGHADTTMTRKIYSHVTDELERDSENMIESLLGGD